MNEESMKKIYFAHRKIIKRWELQYEDKPVVFSDGKKIRSPEPEVETDAQAMAGVDAVDMEADGGADAGSQEVDINNVDDIIKNFVKRPQGSVDDIINSV